MENNLNYSGLINTIYSGNNITEYDNYSYIIDNIDNSVSYCSTDNDNEDINNVINIKNNIINILNSVDDVNGSYVLSDKLVKLTDLFDDFRKEYLEKQSQYLDEEKNMENMINDAKSNIKKLDVVVDFMKTLNTEDCDDGLNSTIIENIKKYTEKIDKNNKLIEAKKKYSESRKDIVKYLDIIKKLNGLNVTNVCPTCLTKPVNIYLNPCGHTLCDECYERIMNNQNHKCFLCRTRVMSKFPLYFS